MIHQARQYLRSNNWKENKMDLNINYYYFAYGSNLLSNRLKKSIENPQFKCRGILKVIKKQINEFICTKSIYH